MIRRICAYSAIPLSEKTRNAWKAAGVVLNPNFTTTDDIVINLGYIGKFWNGCIYNTSCVVEMLHTPGSLRRSPLSALIPPQPAGHFCRDWWLKGPGRGGKNKTRHSGLFQFMGLSSKALKDGWDSQIHVEGKEYRVITVGDQIISVHLKEHGADKSRTYTHISRNLWPSKVAAVARAATVLLPTRKTVIGWDIISSERGTYLLEGNTCPGVNEYSAKGIVEAIRAMP